jgi:hypothetical protein
MECPFSKSFCVECAVYRGRHFSLCFTKKYRGYEWEMGQCMKLEFQGPYGEEDSAFRIPTNIPTLSTVIFNVEDLTEDEEFTRLKTKGEKNDS